MTSRKRRMDDLRACCGQPGPDDGIDPREDKRYPFVQSRKPDRKVRQLCKQVAVTLQLAIGTLPQSDQLLGVTVHTVYPAPNAGRLSVVVTVGDPEQRLKVEAVLNRNRSRLRQEVAEAITRRHAPELIFEVVVEGEGDEDGEGGGDE